VRIGSAILPFAALPTKVTIFVSPLTESVSAHERTQNASLALRLESYVERARTVHC
jgi:hypothetical protein